MAVNRALQQFNKFETEIGVMSFAEELAVAEENQLDRNLGNIFSHVPKEVLAVSRCPTTNELLYLCNWQQDFTEVYFLPSWVQSQVLAHLHYHSLVVEFYERQLPS